MKSIHRIFIAINLPGDIKKQLFNYQSRWPELSAKWTRQENLHITMLFLGYLNNEETAEVCKITKEASQKHSSFPVNLHKIGYGPENKMPPRMIWAKGEKSEEFSSLRNDLEKSLLEAGNVRFSPEGRGFSPHITLARIEKWAWQRIEPEERPEINEEINFVFSAESIEVMESKLKRGGPEYEILMSAPLKTN